MRVIHGDCLGVMPTLASASIDCVITDPPYPEIDRAYGRWTEAEWWDLMMGVCREVRRVLKPHGSAMFVLQPNSRKVGSMRGWLWRFLLWATEEWNVVQDAWWLNNKAMPEAHSIQGRLMRPSLKACVWCGPPDCWRDQDAVLWSEADSVKLRRMAERASGRMGRRKNSPGGQGVNTLTKYDAAEKRGGVSPLNVFVADHERSQASAGAYGHGAGTPLTLMRWWTRYLCPPGGTVLDPFAGSGTAGRAALAEGRDAVMIEKEAEYVEIIRRRHANEVARTPLFAGREV